MTKPRTACASTPKIKAPAGASNTHAHIIGLFERFPLADERGYAPAV